MYKFIRDHCKPCKNGMDLTEKSETILESLSYSRKNHVRCKHLLNRKRIVRMKTFLCHKVLTFVFSCQTFSFHKTSLARLRDNNIFCEILCNIVPWAIIIFKCSSNQHPIAILAERYITRWNQHWDCEVDFHLTWWGALSFVPTVVRVSTK